MIDSTMTEEQARAKWCPMTRVMFRTQFVGNRVDPQYKQYAEGPDRAFLERQEDNTKCIGSACAMWRWSYLRQQVPCPDRSKPEFKDLEGKHWCVECEGTGSVTGETTKGYCGLAGAVQP